MDILSVLKQLNAAHGPSGDEGEVRAKIEELAAKLRKDPALLKRFQDDPVKTLEELTGVDLPDEQLQPLVTGLKAKLAASDLGDALGGLKKLF